MCSRFYTRPTKLTFKWRNVTNLLMVELAILKKQVNWLHCKSDLLQYDSSFGRQCNSINTFLAMVTILYLLKILENLFQELQNGRISQKCVKGCLFGPLFSPPPVRFLPRGGQGLWKNCRQGISKLPAEVFMIKVVISMIWFVWWDC